MKIIPTPLTTSIKEFQYSLEKLSPYYSHMQIDISDGKFVPNKSIQIEDINPLISNKHLTFDFHLMVKDYEKEIKKLISVNNVFIHFSTIDNLELRITNYGFPVGLVLNPEDSIEDLKSKFNLNEIPFIQIMGVHPGAQGNQFLPETLNKIEQLRDEHYRNNIYLDGGISEKTLPLILALKYQPDFLCVGSYLTKELDNKAGLNEKIEFLNHLQSTSHHD
jgi:pentose-5-phosphate-3-epimerase